MPMEFSSSYEVIFPHLLHILDKNKTSNYDKLQGARRMNMVNKKFSFLSKRIKNELVKFIVPENLRDI